MVAFQEWAMCGSLSEAISGRVDWRWEPAVFLGTASGMRRGRECVCSRDQGLGIWAL